MFHLAPRQVYRGEVFQTAARIFGGLVSTILTRLRRYKYFAHMVLNPKPVNGTTGCADFAQQPENNDNLMLRLRSATGQPENIATLLFREELLRIFVVNLVDHRGRQL